MTSSTTKTKTNLENNNNNSNINNNNNNINNINYNSYFDVRQCSVRTRRRRNAHQQQHFDSSILHKNARYSSTAVTIVSVLSLILSLVIATETTPIVTATNRKENTVQLQRNYAYSVEEDDEQQHQQRRTDYDPKQVQQYQDHKQLHYRQQQRRQLQQQADGFVCSGDAVRELGYCIENNSYNNDDNGDDDVNNNLCSKCDTDPTDGKPVIHVDQPKDCDDIYELFCPFVLCCPICYYEALDWYQCSANNVAQRYLDRTCDLESNCGSYYRTTNHETTNDTTTNDDNDTTTKNDSTSTTTSTTTVVEEVISRPLLPTPTPTSEPILSIPSSSSSTETKTTTTVSSAIVEDTTPTASSAAPRTMASDRMLMIPTTGSVEIALVVVATAAAVASCIQFVSIVL